MFESHLTPAVLGLIMAVVGLYLIYLEGTFHAKRQGQPAALPTEQECIELAHVVLSARGIEDMELFARARRLLEAVAERKYNELPRLRAEFCRELIQHQQIYGQLVPPKGAIA